LDTSSIYITYMYPRYLADHLANCEHALISCPHAGCSETPPRREMESHLLSCSRRLISCPCGSTVPYQEIFSHRSTVCPLEEVQCPHQELFFGCTSTCQGKYPRNEFWTHQNSIEYFRFEFQQLSLIVQQQQAKIDRFEEIIAKHENTIRSQVSKYQQLLFDLLRQLPLLGLNPSKAR
jgi:hypothetical protein